MSADEESERVARARAGDTLAFEELARDHAERAYQLAYRMLGHAEDAQDAVQEALIKAYTHLASFRGHASFGTWFHRIVHNCCLDTLRRRRPHLSLDTPREEEDGPLAERLASADPGPEEAAADREWQRHLQAALQQVAPEFRMVLLLRDVQGLDYAEVAAICRCSLGTVKSRLHRGRRQLRAALAGWLAVDEGSDHLLKAGGEEA